ncbi:hypothetical protein J6S55_00225 [Candidatus Saccharibacteria bacterium]|nr:hypothetical protein [Candidatus Saccharibacteria bacterium]
MENENINNEPKNKDVTKEKIILFVIGVLLGAVISTAAFFVYTKTLGTSNSSSTSGQMQGGGTPPEMPSGDNSGNGQGGTPPEKPSEENN